MKKEICCDDYCEALDIAIEIFDGKDDSTIICDREDALIISKLYDDSYGYYSNDISSDYDCYIVSKVKDECFCIQPAQWKENQLYLHESDCVILMDYLSEEVKESYEGDIETILLTCEEGSEYCCSDLEDFCCEDCFCGEDNEKDKLTLSIQVKYEGLDEVEERLEKIELKMKRLGLL